MIQEMRIRWVAAIAVVVVFCVNSGIVVVYFGFIEFCFFFCFSNWNFAASCGLNVCQLPTANFLECTYDYANDFYWAPKNK